MTLQSLLIGCTSPMLKFQIERAITLYGAEAEAAIVEGTPSKRRGSNAQRMAERGLLAKEFEIFVGPRAGRTKASGYRMVIVKTA